MSLVTIVWSMAAASALTLAAIYGFTGLLERRNRTNLLFCVVAVATALLARTELGMMHAADAYTYGQWARWYQLPIFFAIVGEALFVRDYLGTARGWLMWIILVGRLIVVSVNFMVEPNFNWERIDSLAHVSFLGEQVAVVGHAELRSWQWLPTTTRVLLIVFIVDAARRLWLTGDAEARHRALVIGYGFAIPLAGSVALAQAAVLGLARLPVLGTVTFLVTIGVMAFELSRELVLSRQARSEAVELRDELARTARVTALGQLASALAHELAQPLGAILRNAEAAEMQLEKPAPELTEIKAILGDIRKDDMRASEIIEHMRAMIKRQSIDARPLAVGDLLRATVVLAHAEAVARHITVDCVVASDLPPVVADRVHISQVLLNLIINGMDAIESGAPQVRRIVIEARTGSGRTVEVAVMDSGPGIRPELIDRVFAPFFTTKSSGMGMGLPLSRTIIEAHGGRLWAENNSTGQGARFRFTLPCVMGAVS